MSAVRLLVDDKSGYSALWDEEALAPLVAPHFDVKKLPTTRQSLHITLLTKTEAGSLKRDHPFRHVAFTSDDVVPLGLGGDKAIFLVVLCNKANLLRKKAGLPLKDFHISLLAPSHASPEDFPHGLSTLRAPPPTTPLALDALAHHQLLSGDFFASRSTAAEYCALDLTQSKPFIRLGDAALRLSQHKLALLAYGRAWYFGEGAVRAYALRQLLRAGRDTEWGTTYLAYEAAQLDDLPYGVRDALLEPWSDALKEELLEACEQGRPPELCIEARELHRLRLNGEEQKLMRNFRWIVPFHLAISSIPRQSDIPLLASPALGIRHVVSLTEQALPSGWFKIQYGISLTHIPIDDYRPPTVAQIQLFLLAVHNADGPVLVHCAGGKGRAGTMVAAYLIAFGFARPPARWTFPVSSPSQALQDLRRIRPLSVETGAQEDALRAFCKHLSSGGQPYPAHPVEPPASPVQVDGHVGPDADLVVLVGLPGSGKSFLRCALVARDLRWRSVSGDEDGGSSAVLAAVSSLRAGHKLVVDRCNASSADRKALLDLAQHAKHAVAVFLDFPPDLCAQRAQLRSDHPTLPPGPRVLAAIKQFTRSLESPQLREGFAGVAVIKSLEASSEVVRRLTPSWSGLLKFPRTPHLYNLGSATADDLVSSLDRAGLAPQRPLPPGTRLVLTEKVDGANLAFSLSSSRQLLVQNRSHYLSGSGAHAQFRALDRWMEDHAVELQELLSRDEHFPERFILYGEWMAATHSVAYNALPSLFLAYDLYDRTLSRFVPRSTLEALLSPGTSQIPLVPVLHVREAARGENWPSKEELETLVQGPSAFIRAEQAKERERRMEGVYLKLEDEEEVLERS
ncbi:uncharacterized protein JCM10292_001523 [Rhodotorula paludigena]|uniref:uncharacterized protein n=1 Tax=Rhodotorula paludigena TaxID=86838 RepID=UPI00317C0A71